LALVATSAELAMSARLADPAFVAVSALCACCAPGTVPSVLASMSAPPRLPSFTFAPVTASRRSWCVPTLSLPSFPAAIAVVPPIARTTAIVAITLP